MKTMFKKLTSKQKRIMIYICGSLFIVIVLLLIIIGVSRPTPVANREDFIGKTFMEAKALADELGIRYDIDNGNGIYDWESESTQIIDWITSVYDENDDYVDGYNRYTSHDFLLYKGWRISLATDIKTDKQKNDEEVCRAKDGYAFNYKDGKVDCHKTQETLCKESGKVWYKNSYCKTQEEIDEEEKWNNAHSACKKYGSNGYAKTLTDCYVGNEYVGSVSGEPKPESQSKSKEEPKQEQTKQDQSSENTSGNNPTPSSTPTDTTPSIDTVADACWAYGRSHGVHLTDYASTNISKDGNYYQILMWHDDGSVWKCWYNPSDKDVFIEKTNR